MLIEVQDFLDNVGFDIEVPRIHDRPPRMDE